MTTKLDMRTDLSQKINLLSASDIQKLKIFLTGMEAAKTLQMADVPIAIDTNGQQRENA